MAEPLKNSFGPDVPRHLAQQIAAVHPHFDTSAFLRDALQGFEALELMPRGKHLASVLQRHLPAHYPDALAVLLASTRQPVQRRAPGGMAGFYFMPHCFYVAAHGLGHFEASMAAQHHLTQLFTCEFSIRPYLTQHPAPTLARLHEWTQDPSEHVRRLVSEGCRPRLPWAMRLPAFQADPRPVLDLLERLKDDPALYVRRSVANNLNDIGKDHPDVLVDVARRWLRDASPDREWLVRHALRWAVKQGQPGALKVLGYGAQAQVTLLGARIQPARATVGGKLAIAFELHNPTRKAQDLMVDFQIHYVKVNGGTAPKVFKLKELSLPPGATALLRKTVSLQEMTTRKHHAGKHRVDVLVNGAELPLGAFMLSQ